MSSRRNFLKRLTGTSALGLGSVLLSGKVSGMPAGNKKHLLPEGTTLVFQGDSITDAVRNKKKEDIPNHAYAMGVGYVTLTASTLLYDNAGRDIKIFNRGISGNKVYQLADRWDKDCLDLKPDILSILIGVNDIWHTLNGRYNGTVEKYERDYDALIDRTLKALPHVRLIICEPFVLRTGAVNEKWFPEFDQYRAAAKKIADKYKATFVPFQDAFNSVLGKAPADYWTADGVHPTLAGSELMHREWLKYL
jgi:lysophospholipase L1-like esterase